MRQTTVSTAMVVLNGIITLTYVLTLIQMALLMTRFVNIE